MRIFEDEASNRGYKSIAGIDEVGRGPLAGPVVAAAVILPDNFYNIEITDSKQISEKKREQLYPIIMDKAVSVGIGMSFHYEIDEINILQASLKAMRRAVKKLSISPDFLLIDGKFSIKLPIAQKAVIKGDTKSISIASASIIAKVTRDIIMKKFHLIYPEYGFDKHKGYPTKFHKKTILHFGPSPIHRKTFKGVKEVLNA